MNRSVLLLLLVISLGSIAENSNCWAEEELPTIEVWAERIQGDLQRLYEKADEIDKTDQMGLCLRTIHVLARVGRAEEAIAISEEKLDAIRQAIGYQTIADAQSTSDDVEGAWKTASLIQNEHYLASTHQVIAIRQAQRGDFEDSLQLLERLTSQDEKDDLRRTIIDKLMKARRYQEVLI
ncbi:Hypothetical protein PBC10988_24560 [Planctomycetales bacterium 10988]|nr:Hypothetical protein PBC10988_24560 [Planctomycetales bacterium 10988]